MEISTRQARYLLALGEHQHFGRAARALGVTQPALSQAIRQFESVLGVRLVDRTPRGATLNQFGEVALRFGHRMTEEVDDLRRELTQMQGLSAGSLSIVAGAHAGEISGHLAIASMLARHPGVRVRLKIMEWNRIAQPLLSREADLALAEISIAESDPRLVAESVATHRLIFVTRPGHPLTRLRRELTIADLTGYPWATMPIPPRMYAHFPRGPLQAGRFDPAEKRFIPAVRVDTVRGALQVVGASDAITGAAAGLIAHEVQSGELVALPFEAPWFRLNYGFIYLRDRSLSPAAKAYMADVRRLEAELASRARQSTKAGTVRK